jgi:hypothetical protein
VKAFALVALVSFGAFAADPLPADAPVAEAPVPNLQITGSEPVSETTAVNQGDALLVVGPAIVLPADSAIRLARRITMTEAERDALKDDVAKSTPSWVVPVVAVVAFVAGGALGASIGIAYANTHPK